MTDYSNSSQDRNEYQHEPEDPKAQSFNKIDLSNQKSDNIVEGTNEQVFSATANQFLAVSGNSSQGIIVQPAITNQQTIHNFASGANSPTGLSSITMQTYTNNAAPMGMSHTTSAMGPHSQVAPHMQMVDNQMQNQQTSNLKAATTHNTNQLNYFSNLQTAQIPGNQESGAATSLGRVTGKIETDSNEGKRTAPVKSGILAQSGTSKQSGTTGIKRVPSRTKINEKNGRKLNYRTGPSTQQTQQDQVEVPVHHQQSRSQGKNQNRGTSQSNRVMHQDAQAVMQQNIFAQNGQIAGNGEVYQGFSFVQMGQNPSFQFSQQPNIQQMQPGQLTQQQQQMLASGGYQMQPQPQVHFIAKQQKFYGISPERAPMIFNNGQQQSDKRPYTSSGQAIGKQRINLSKVGAHNQAIAALYLGGHKGVSGNQVQQRNSSQPNQDVPSGLAAHQSQVAAYSMHSIPAKTTKRTIQQANSAAAARKQQSGLVYGPGNQFTAKESEALYDEAIKMKQLANMHKDENIKLKTKIKILENEMGRKERTLEDFFQQNQFIQNAQKNQATTGPLAPIAQTAQRYQQETFLVMSLKKQVKELKSVNEKKEEELSNCKKNIKQTRFFEAEQEIKVYKDELIRLRYLLEQHMTTRDTRSHAAMQMHGSQPGNLTTSQSLVGAKMTTSQSTTENTVKPPLMIGFQMNSETTADNVSSQDEKLPLLKTGSATINQQQMLLTGITGFNNQPLHEQTTPVVSQPLSTNGFSSIDQREYKNGDTELTQILSSQISDRDATIRAMQQQLDDIKRRSLLKGDNSVTPDKEAVEDSKVKAVSKEAQAKLKKLVREKDKEILKLKQEISNAATINAKFTETNEEENNKKIKKLEVQVSTYLKKTQDLKSTVTSKDAKIDQLAKDLEKANTDAKQSVDKGKKDAVNSKKLQKQVDELMKEIENYKKASTTLVKEKKSVVVAEADKPAEESKYAEFEKQADEIKPIEPVGQEKQNKKPIDKVEEEAKLKEEQQEEKLELDEKAEGELCLAATVIGCRNNKDRIEFAQYIKEFVKEQNGKKSKEDDLLILSEELSDYVKKEQIDKLALILPKYEYITPSLGLVILGDIRKLLMSRELLEILSEKETEEKLPFDALRDLCSKFEKNFTDEQCAFICSTYLVQIETGVIFINFAHFLSDIKDFDLTGAKSNESKSPRRGSLGPNSDLDSESGKDPKKKGLGAHLAKRDGNLGKKKSFDEEQMLDIAEACFIKMAELMVQRGRTVRGIFTKYSVPEMFPDRTVLELLNPINFLEGVREAGLEDLQEMEAACLMRVLSKPELDNAIILNELVLIMENFGVMDQLDDDELDDYIPDTETDVEKSVTEDKEIADKEEKKGEKEAKEEEKNKKQKDKKRTHNLANIDSKGIRILRKLARYLLKQFLHPREFFGKTIKKEKIKTKKREFSIDVIKVKEFYLKIKIANIRKKLTENESLNLELCLDKKNHKDLFNVKLMVKALEELAEEEQALLIKEEQELKVKKDEKDKEKVSLTAITESEPDTPRSDSKESEKQKSSKEKINEAKSEEEEKSKESEYGVGSISDIVKFGNSRIHSNSAPNSGRSPLMGSGAYHQLNTIEEEKHETQTSNYIEGASEREDSKLLGSNNLRGSNFMKDFDLDEEQKKSLSKLSPEILNKSLLKDEVRQSLFDELQINKPESLNSAKEVKDKKMSQSVAETSIERFKEHGKSEAASNDGEEVQAK